MTLVIPFVSRNFNMIITDRRFTLPSGRSVDDDANKIVVFNRHHCFAYTGLAIINGKPTDLWLADVLSSVRSGGLQSAAMSIARRAQDEFRHLHVPRKYRHQSFIGIGWTRIRDTTDLWPALVRVSNSYAFDGTAKNQPADEFALHMFVLGKHRPFTFSSEGQRLPRAHIVWLDRILRRAGERRITPLRAWQLLTSMMTEVSRTNSFVGRGLLGVCFPRAALQHDKFVMTSPLGGSVSFDDANPSFIDVLARNEKFVLHGPTIVTNGVTIHRPVIIELDGDSLSGDSVARQYAQRA